MTDENYEEGGPRPIGDFARAVLVGAFMAAILAGIVIPKL